jgi:pimeloyl-ACP methyl ester carboxylesterase
MARKRTPARFSILAAGCLLGLAAVNGILTLRAARRYPAKGQYVEVDGISIHYVVLGEGPPLVILHGNGSMIEDFLASDLVPMLARRHRVFLFDRPGYGHSASGWGWWTAEDQARLMDLVLRRLGVSGEVLLGHSWGTLVALALARIRNCRGMVLLSGYYFPTVRLDVLSGALPASPVIGALWRWTFGPLLGRLFSNIFFQRLFSPNSVTDQFKNGFSVGLSVSPRSLKSSGTDAILMIPTAYKLSKHYSEIEVPTVIVAGEEDQIVCPAQSQQLCKVMSNASLVMVPGAGHMIHHTNPNDVLVALNNIENLEPCPG